MRILFALIIFAIGFSGYITAVHAYAGDLCGTGETAAMAIADCPNHQPEKSSSHQPCADCTHCCISYATGHDMQLSGRIAEYAAPDLRPVSLGVGDYIVVPLRPPKSPSI